MMPTSHTRQIVSNLNGQKRINLRAALETQQHKTSAVDMTFGELARAYLAVHYNGADMQLRKWIGLLDSRSAWEVSAKELARAGIAMIDNGYSPSTVNRNPHMTIADKALNRIVQIMKELELSPKSRSGYRSNYEMSPELKRFLEGP